MSFTSEQRVTAHAQGNMLFGVRVVPGYFGARLRSEASYFRVTRDALAFTSAGAATLVTSSVATTGQGEVRTRLFLDAEVAALAGFVPAIFGGLDVLVLAGGAAETNVVPLVGLAIVRPTW